MYIYTNETIEMNNGKDIPQFAASIPFTQSDE
jgi:hypothetical protein